MALPAHPGTADKGQRRCAAATAAGVVAAECRCPTYRAQFGRRWRVGEGDGGEGVDLESGVAGRAGQYEGLVRQAETFRGAAGGAVRLAEVAEGVGLAFAAARFAVQGQCLVQVVEGFVEAALGVAY